MKRPALILVTAALLLGGCGGGSGDTSATGQRSESQGTSDATTNSMAKQPGRPAATKPKSREALGVAVREALAANHRLAVKVLWTNRIPATAKRSTGGPALAELAASAKDRRTKRVRIRMIRDDYRITSITFGRTGASATAIAEWDQRVVPSHLDGRPFGRPVSLKEKARIELRRVADSGSFVVWRVTLVK